jgi:hypothetical protein
VIRRPVGRRLAGVASATLAACALGAAIASASGPLDAFPIQILDSHGNCVAVSDHRTGRVTLDQYERISGLGPAALEHIKDGTAPAALTVSQWHAFRAAFAAAARVDGVPDTQAQAIGSSTKGYGSCRKTSNDITVLTTLGVRVIVTYEELVKAAPDFWRTVAATRSDPTVHALAETYLARAKALEQHAVPPPPARVFDEETLLTGDLSVRSDYDISAFSQDVNAKVHRLVRSTEVDHYVAALQRTSGAADPGTGELSRTVQAEYQELHGMVLDQPRGGKYAIGVAKRGKLRAHPEEKSLLERVMTGGAKWTPELIERFIVRSEFAGRIIKKDFGPFLAPHLFRIAARFAKEWDRSVNVALNPPGRFGGGKWTVMGPRQP